MVSLLASSLARGGVRQGDALSPLLFCLAEDVLSRGISLLIQTRKLLPMVGPRGIPIPSHILYADDIMIFCKGTRRNLSTLVSLFDSYGQASGQQLSLGNCKFFVGAMPNNRIASIANILGFSKGQLPFSYLGVLIFKGKASKIHLEPIVDKIKAKMAAWKGALLSIMGRVQLVKSIIHGMLVYSFHVYAWPISLLKQLDSCIRNFIWADDIKVRKLSTMAWHKVCSPFNEGGLGLRSLKAINDAAMLKLSWDITSSN